MHRNVSTLLHFMGFFLIGIGTLADSLAGLVILNHHLEAGMLAHLIATSIWMLGLIIARIPHIRLAVALGSILFPGMGILAWMLASCVTSLTPRQKPTIDDDGNQLDLLADIRSAVERELETSLRPIVEVPYISDSKIKRAALDLLCREPSQHAMTLARGFLADSDSDVRALAAVAVSILESRMSELVKSALSQVELHQQDPESHAALGHANFECATKCTNDSMNRGFYLSQSRQAFENALALDQTRDDIRIRLADVLIRLGKVEEAWEMFAKAFMKDTRHDPRIYLLGCEIAFRARRFERLVDIARQARAALSENDEAFAIMNWWQALETVRK